MTAKDTEGIVTKELETFKAQGANILMPSIHISGMSEFHSAVIETVQLSPKPDDGDVYPHDTDGKKFRPTKQALMKLSVCAGVIWSPTESRRTDNGADRNYIAYKAVGGIKKADGQPVFFSAEYDIDFEVMEEELRELYTRKSEGKGAMGWIKDKTPQFKQSWIEDCVKRDMLQKRKFKLRLCEAGAMNRVLRMLLGIKQAYTGEELSKPFVTARIVFKPDFSDAKVKQQFIDASIKAMTGIYGPTAAAAIPDRQEPIDVTPVAEDPPENGHQEADPPPSKEESMVLDFQNADLTIQCKSITDLSHQKGYNLADYQARSGKPLGDMTPEVRTNLFKYLRTLPDLKPAAEEDVPFDLGRA